MVAFLFDVIMTLFPSMKTTSADSHDPLGKKVSRRSCDGASSQAWLVTLKVCLFTFLFFSVHHTIFKRRKSLVGDYERNHMRFDDL